MKSRWPTRAEWLEIAEAFDVPLGKRNKRQLKLTASFNYRIDEGICYALGAMRYSYEIIEGFNCEDTDNYWWGLSSEGNCQRVLFCCFMATITKKDFREMERQP